MSDNGIFCKIAAGEIPSNRVYEDDDFVAFHDINPAAPIHLLLIPKQHVKSLADIKAEDGEWLGRMVVVAQKLAFDNGCTPGHDGGFRLVVNTGREGGQEVDHLHLH